MSTCPIQYTIIIFIRGGFDMCCNRCCCRCCRCCNCMVIAVIAVRCSGCSGNYRCCRCRCCKVLGLNQNDWDNNWWPVWTRVQARRQAYRAGFNDGYRVGFEDGRRNWRLSTNKNRRAGTGRAGPAFALEFCVENFPGGRRRRSCRACRTSFEGR